MGTCCATAGNPIEIGTGLEVIRETDISINGPRGAIFIQRTYRSRSLEAGPFGLGSNHNYGYRLSTNNPRGAAVINLILPNGSRIPFISDGVEVYTNETVPGVRGALLSVLVGGETDLRWKDGTVFHFVPANLVLGSVLESITDSNGNQILLIRNPTRPAQITEIVDPVGRKLLLNYDGTDRIISVVDPIGREVLYTYNTFGTLETITNPEGGVTRYDYDAADRLSQITDARGVVVALNTYDANGRVIQQVQADTGVITFDYTLLNPEVTNSPVQETVVTDAVGTKTTYRFNPQGFLTEVTDGLGQTRVFERESGSNLLLVRKGAGSCPVCGDTSAGDVTFTYDERGNVLSRTDALGEITEFEYDPVFNNVKSITNPLGHMETRTYDNSGNMVSRTDENGNTTNFDYNQFGQIIKTTDALNHVTTFDYDSFGNLVAVNDPLENVTGFQYDEISRRIKSVDALGRSTKTKYDKLDRVVAVTDAKGNKTKTAYDAVGNRISMIDARDNTISFVYDEMKYLATRIDSLGNIDALHYDLSGNIREYVDRRGYTSSYTYDELNRLITETYQDGALVQRTYDVHGRLKQVDDTEGETFVFDYDVLGRILISAGPFGTVKYSRDKMGRMAQRQVVGQPTVNYAYDAAGNLLSAAMPNASVVNSFSPPQSTHTSVTNQWCGDRVYL